MVANSSLIFQRGFVDIRVSKQSASTRGGDAALMIVHQHPGVKTPTDSRAGFPHGVHEHLAVAVAFHDCFAPVASSHHVVEGAGIFEARLSGHGCAPVEDNLDLSRIID
jgi:hypothetical protein